MPLTDSEGNPAGAVHTVEPGRWTVAECQNKGLGLFAGKAYEPGEVILCEQPISVVDDDTRVSERLLQKLPAGEKKSLLELQNKGTGLVGVFNTNGFFNTQGHAVYRMISRVNHCCVPNAFVDVKEDGEAVLKALQPICKTNEVTISYHRESHGMSRKIRRSILESTKKFRCQCVSCDTDDIDVALGGCDEAMETQDLQMFILSHSSDSGVDRSLEEFASGVHVVGKLLSYKHWGCLHIAFSLMENAAAAVSHYTEAGDKKSATKWSIILLKLLTYAVSRCKALFPTHLSSTHTQALYSAASCLLANPSPAFPLIVLVFKYIQPFHIVYYGAEDPDTLVMAAVLEQYVGKKVSGVGTEEDEVASRLYLSMNLNDESVAAIERHTERLVKKFAQKK